MFCVLNDVSCTSKIKLLSSIADIDAGVMRSVAVHYFVGTSA